MKVRYEIEHTEYYDKKGKTVLWSLFFDRVQFDLDKEDLLTIVNILKTVFEGMDDTEGVIFPLWNRERVMKTA